MAKQPNLPRYHLTKDAEKGNWKLEKAGGDRAVRRFETKKEALQGGALKEAIGKAGGSVRVHKADGKIQEERTFPRARDPKDSAG